MLCSWWDNDDDVDDDVDEDDLGGSIWETAEAE